MTSGKIETAYDLLQKSIDLLAGVLDIPFLEGYLESFGNLIDGQVKVQDGLPNEADTKQLNDWYQELAALDLSDGEKRQVTQLLMLAGAKSDQLSANHQLTPDSLGYLFLFLLEQFFSQKKQLTILDPTSGLGNLLTTVLVGAKESKKDFRAIGVENDDLLIEVAGANAEYLDLPIQYFHQDALQPLLIEPVDAVIADLPIGFYPQKDVAQKFITGKNVTEELAYAHHLLIEASFKYVKEDCVALFLVPTKLFESAQAMHFTQWLKESAYLQGMIALPKKLFQNTDSQKSILILQKPGSTSQQAPEVLLLQLGDLQKPSEVQKFAQQFTTWKTENLK
ncbi:class I SAM-dependent methyltransferase [Enterococcus timonensis]|uniref:class I SAM-dependent methyltransferase n=1 Tax=Enterococcus timonensis TaxID=1852364 RepID=UPI0008DA994E|nr:class I SAM-dependent methyltransferase [Enterococcus timonensis]